mgnify:CR=1 FL=1
MARESLSKLVSSATRKATQPVQEIISKAQISTVSKGSDLVTKLQECCNPDNLVPCITAITLIVYIVVVSPTTVLDIFASPVGKFVSMSIVMLALLFDVRLGVMVGLAVVLSINMASANEDVYESYTVSDNYDAEDDHDDQLATDSENADNTMGTEVKEEVLETDVQVEDNALSNLSGFDTTEPLFASLSEDSEMMS